MKKCVFFSVLLVALGSGAFAQGVYFDIGLGLGKGTTKLDGNDVADAFSGTSVTDVAVELGLKLGGGPIAGVPLYVVGELGGMGHRFEDSYNYIQFNSYLVGAGVIYYPVPLLQLGASAGWSFVSNRADLPVTFYKSESGFAWDVSLALDLGKGTSGCLLGVKYFSATNTLEISGAEEQSSLIGVFVRYAYRHKVPAKSE